MKVPFTWKVTGWFMVGWSAEFPRGDVRPLQYFGDDLVAYRDESGELHVMSAHCRHLGAHIGHGGKVVGDCVECPFHGWRWGPDGTNRYIPYQPDRPNKALRLRVFPVREQYGCVFVWHQPDGKQPQWEMPDLFHKFPQFSTDPDAYYRPYPEFSRRAEHEPVHPQIVAENGPDSAHFHYVHGATVTPVCLNWEAVDEVGVSVNVAITNLVMDAVNAAYRVVVPRDALAGIPTDYANAIIDNTLSLLATIVTTDDLLDAWK